MFKCNQRYIALTNSRYLTWLKTYLISACQWGYPFSMLNESMARYPAFNNPLSFPASIKALYTGTHDSFGMWSSHPISPTKLTRNANTWNAKATSLWNVDYAFCTWSWSDYISDPIFLHFVDMCETVIA